MKAIFAKRRRQFVSRCLSYLPYVLNDHFVLVVLVALGGAALSYRQLLQGLPETSGLLLVLVVAVSLILQSVGGVALYVEEADKLCLLPKEEEIAVHIRQAARRSIYLWGSVQSLCQLLFLPVHRALGLPWWGSVLWLVFLWIARYGVVQWRLRSWVTDQGVRWEPVLTAEHQRKQGILRFFALFARVKGVQPPASRRSYLNGLAGLVSRRQGRMWDYLFWRSYLRTGDFFPLTVRLLGLSLCCVFAFSLSWGAGGGLLLVQYLFLFQMLGLYRVFDGHPLLSTYPVTPTERWAGFVRVLGWLGSAFFAVQFFVFALVWRDMWLLVFFCVASAVLRFVYLPIKSKKLID